MAPKQDSNLHDILLTIGRIEGRLELLLSNHLPHIHTEIAANRKLILWVGGILTTLILGVMGTMIRLLVG